ncbi:MAG: LptF/LptG family permease [Hyphomicrobiales bacterium]
MNKIDIYIIKKFLGTFFFTIALLSIIIVVFDFAENYEDLSQAPMNKIIFEYYCNFIPYFLNLFLYLFTFISVILFTSKMASRTEIIAILSSGISFRRMLWPWIFSAILLALLSFTLGNFIIPETQINLRKFKEEYMSQLKKERGQNIHLQLSPGEFVYVSNYSIKYQIGYKFSLEKYVDDSLVYKLNAERIEYDTANKSWMIRNYFIRNLSNDTTERLSKGYSLDTIIDLQPEDFYLNKEEWQEMNYFQLNAQIKEFKEKGIGNVSDYEVEMQKRMAAPFATLILTLIGVSLSSRKVRGGIGLHLAAGIALTFTYILFQQFTTVFSTYGDLPPFLAAWIPNFIFIFIMIYLLRKAPK